MKKLELDFKEKIGYSSASLGDAVAYNLAGTFLMFFLTSIAGLEPAISGTITAIGAIWNALFSPVIGRISDKVKTIWGRRRPFMFVAAFLLFASIFLLFTSIEMNYTLKVFYYGFVVMLFWTSYTSFFVPYFALGSEYTKDYSERTILRSYAAFLGMIGTAIAMVSPTFLVEIFSDAGMTVKQAWSAVGGLVAAITSISILLTVKVSKHKNTCGDEQPQDKLRIDLRKTFKGYLEILSHKPMKYLTISSFFFLIAYTMIMSDIIYFFTYNNLLSAGNISAILLYRCLLCIVLILPITKLCVKTDKKISLDCNNIVMRSFCCSCKNNRDRWDCAIIYIYVFRCGGNGDILADNARDFL